MRRLTSSDATPPIGHIQGGPGELQTIQAEWRVSGLGRIEQTDVHNVGVDIPPVYGHVSGILYHGSKIPQRLRPFTLMMDIP